MSWVWMVQPDLDTQFICSRAPRLAVCWRFLSLDVTFNWWPCSWLLLLLQLLLLLDCRCNSRSRHETPPFLRQFLAKARTADGVDEEMRRDFDCQCQWRQVGEVEVERAASLTGDRQRCRDDAADRIQQLAGHEHEHDDHQRLGHVVLFPSPVGHVLTTGHGSQSWTS